MSASFRAPSSIPAAIWLGALATSTHPLGLPTGLRRFSKGSRRSGGCFSKWQVPSLAGVPHLQLDVAGCRQLLPDYHLHGQPDQVGVVELYPGARVPVVEQTFEPLRLELRDNPCRGFRLPAALGRDDYYLERHRSDGRGPSDATVVAVLLDHGLEHARSPDAVCAHDTQTGHSVPAGEVGLQRLGVLQAQLEDMTYLDAARDLELAIADRAEVALHGSSQVGYRLGGKIAAFLGAAVVVVDLVGAGDQAAGALHLLVEQDPDPGQAHRTGEAGRDGREQLALVLAHHVEIRRTQRLGELRLDDVAVPRHEDRNELLAHDV